MPEVVRALPKDEENERNEAEAKKREFVALSKLASDSTWSSCKQLKLTLMMASTEKVDTDRALTRIFYAISLPFVLAKVNILKKQLQLLLVLMPITSHLDKLLFR